MDPLLRGLYWHCLITAIGSLTACPIAIYCLNRSIGPIHLNFRILLFFTSFVWFIQGASNLIVEILLMTDKTEHTYYVLMRLIMSTSLHMLRQLPTALCAERWIATYYSKVYESDKRCFLISPCIITAILLLSSFYSLIFNMAWVSVDVIYIISFMNDIVTFIFTLLIRRRNQTLHLMVNTNVRSLSHKYQIVENIRVLRALVPHAAIGLIASMFAFAASIGLRHYFGSLYGSPGYYSIYNYYVMIMAIYWGHRYSKRQTTPPRNSTSPSVDPNNIVVKNALGGTIQTKQTVEDHIMDLKNMWNESPLLKK